MFEGKAEAAMRFYTSLFADSGIQTMTRYGPGEAGREGTVQHATFALAGQQFMCIDSPASHPSRSHRRCRCTCSAIQTMRSSGCIALWLRVGKS
nr:VOC family protein [Mycobacterium angelicum]